MCITFSLTLETDSPNQASVSPGCPEEERGPSPRAPPAMLRGGIALVPPPALYSITAHKER